MCASEVSDWSESSLCAQSVGKDPAVFMRTAKILIRPGGCPCLSKSSLGTHILLVLSCRGSYSMAGSCWACNRYKMHGNFCFVCIFSCLLSTTHRDCNIVKWTIKANRPSRNKASVGLLNIAFQIDSQLRINLTFASFNHASYYQS